VSMKPQSDTSAPPAPEFSPQDPAQSPDGLVGGTFRLDAMSPGAEAGSPAQMAAPPKAWKSRQGFALIVLLMGAAVVVYGMRRLGFGPLSALGQVKMPDYDVTKSPKVTSSDQKRLLSELAATHMDAQVPADQVQKNPFRLADAMRTTTPDPGDNSDAANRAMLEKQRREAEAHRRAVEQALAGLTIHGILDGSSPVARINDRNVRVGDTLADVFTVKAIHGRSIEVTCDDQTYTISMDEPDAKTPGKKR